MSASIQLLFGSCIWSFLLSKNVVSSEFRGGSRTAATSKMERFVIIVNGLKLLTIIIKRSILDVATVLDQPLELLENLHVVHKKLSQSKSDAAPFDFKLKLGRSSVKRSVLGEVLLYATAVDYRGGEYNDAEELLCAIIYEVF